MHQLDIKVLNIIDAWCNHEVYFMHSLIITRDSNKLFPLQSQSVLRLLHQYTRCTAVPKLSARCGNVFRKRMFDVADPVVEPYNLAADCGVFSSRRYIR